MPNEPQMSPISRCALVTAIGILLGFTLTFFEHWNEAPGAWRARHIPPVVALALGVVLVLVGFILAAVT